MGRELQLVTTSPEETRKLAATVAGALRPGDVVALTGELGAGKTCFVQGAAAALGVAERVTSPSFVLRREYPAPIPVLHLDIYRLDTLWQVADIGYEDALGRDRITFIEWGDAMSPLLPNDHLEVELRVGLGGPQPATDARHIVVRAHGDDWSRRLAGVAADLQAWRDRPGTTADGS